MFGRQKLATIVAELLGTGALTLIVLSVSRSSIGLPYFIALATGVAVTVLVYAFGTNARGAQLNPAITLGLWSVRKLKTLDAVTHVIAQLAGGWLAYVLFTYFVNTTLEVQETAFALRIMVAEAVGAFVLAFAWAAAVQRRTDALAQASVVGLAYVVGILIASTAQAGLLNPAVALGTRAWEWGNFVLGPVLGAVVGFNLYTALFADKEKVVASTTSVRTIEAVSETPGEPTKKTVVKTTTKTKVTKKPAKAKK